MVYLGVKKGVQFTSYPKEQIEVIDESGSYLLI